MAADNLFLNLHRWAHRQDENFKTDSLAFLLRQAIAKEPRLAERLLDQLTGMSWERELSRHPVSVETQHHTVRPKRLEAPSPGLSIGIF